MFAFIDVEDLYFPKTDPQNTYASPRSREEVAELLMREVRAHENFVFAAVNGDFGEAIRPFYRYAVLLHAPKEVRLQRVRDRSFQKFGTRMLPGGDLHEREEAFFTMVAARTERAVEEWVQSLPCRVIRVDGTKPINQNVAIIKSKITARQMLE